MRPEVEQAMVDAVVVRRLKEQNADLEADLEREIADRQEELLDNARLRRQRADLLAAGTDVVQAEDALRDAKKLHPRLVTEIRMQKVEAIDRLRAAIAQAREDMP